MARARSREAWPSPVVRLVAATAAPTSLEPVSKPAVTPAAARCLSSGWSARTVAHS
nr:MAG TPA: hypothetical protein [Caudoviricetes sp.]